MYFDKKIETMKRDEMRELQRGRLVRLVNVLYEKNASYRKKMDDEGVSPSDIRSIADITKLPFTTKQDLRDGYPFGMFSAKRKDIVRLHASSGTTGKLTVVGYTKRDLETWAELSARCLTFAGGTADDVVQVAYGYGLFTGGLGMHDGSQRLGAMTVPVSSGNTARQLALAKDFGATVICCTPSYALYISEQLEKEGLTLNDLKFRIGVFGAEPWTAEMKTEIERRLGLEAFDIYGLSEIMGPGVSMDCKEHDGLHINEDHFYPEIVDPDTLEPLAEGERGELVITTLTKEGIPLIRYRTRDISRLNYAPCKCGRTLVRMDRVTGRSDDMLIIKGVNVFPSQVESVLMGFSAGTSRIALESRQGQSAIGGASPHLSPHYQIIVDRVGNLDTCEIAVELSESEFSDEVSKLQALKKEIERAIEDNLMVSAKITLVSPNTLTRSEGKAKHVIDRRKARPPRAE